MSIPVQNVPALNIFNEINANIRQALHGVGHSVSGAFGSCRRAFSNSVSGLGRRISAAWEPVSSYSWHVWLEMHKTYASSTLCSSLFIVWKRFNIYRFCAVNDFLQGTLAGGSSFSLRATCQKLLIDWHSYCHSAIQWEAKIISVDREAADAITQFYHKYARTIGLLGQPAHSSQEENVALQEEEISGAHDFIKRDSGRPLLEPLLSRVAGMNEEPHVSLLGAENSLLLSPGVPKTSNVLLTQDRVHQQKEPMVENYDSLYHDSVTGVQPAENFQAWLDKKCVGQPITLWELAPALLNRMQQNDPEAPINLSEAKQVYAEQLKLKNTLERKFYYQQGLWEVWRKWGVNIDNCKEAINQLLAQQEGHAKDKQEIQKIYDKLDTLNAAQYPRNLEAINQDIKNLYSLGLINHTFTYLASMATGPWAIGLGVLPVLASVGAVLGFTALLGVCWPIVIGVGVWGIIWSIFAVRVGYANVMGAWWGLGQEGDKRFSQLWAKNASGKAAIILGFPAGLLILACSAFRRFWDYVASLVIGAGIGTACAAVFHYLLGTVVVVGGVAVTGLIWPLSAGAIIGALLSITYYHQWNHVPTCYANWLKLGIEVKSQDWQGAPIWLRVLTFGCLGFVGFAIGAVYSGFLSLPAWWNLGFEFNDSQWCEAVDKHPWGMILGGLTLIGPAFFTLGFLANSIGSWAQGLPAWWRLGFECGVYQWLQEVTNRPWGMILGVAIGFVGPILSALGFILNSIGSCWQGLPAWWSLGFEYAGSKWWAEVKNRPWGMLLGALSLVGPALFGIGFMANSVGSWWQGLPAWWSLGFEYAGSKWCAEVKTRPWGMLLGALSLVGPVLFGIGFMANSVGSWWQGLPAWWNLGFEYEGSKWWAEVKNCPWGMLLGALSLVGPALFGIGFMANSVGSWWQGLPAWWNLGFEYEGSKWWAEVKNCPWGMLLGALSLVGPALFGIGFVANSIGSWWQGLPAWWNLGFEYEGSKWWAEVKNRPWGMLLGALSLVGPALFGIGFVANSIGSWWQGLPAWWNLGFEYEGSKWWAEVKNCPWGMLLGALSLVGPALFGIGFIANSIGSWWQGLPAWWNLGFEYEGSKWWAEVKNRPWGMLLGALSLVGPALFGIGFVANSIGSWWQGLPAWWNLGFEYEGSKWWAEVKNCPWGMLLGALSLVGPALFGIGFIANSIGSWWQGLPAWWNLGFEYEGSKWWAEVKNRPWGMLLGVLSLVGPALFGIGFVANSIASWGQGLPAWWNLGFEYEGSKWWAEVKNRPWGMLLGALSLVGPALFGIGFVANSIGSWWQGLPAWWNLGFEYEGSKWWAEVKNRPWGMLLGALSLVGPALFGIGFVANSIGSWWQGLPAWWNLGFEYEGSKWWAEVKNRPWGMLLGALSLVGPALFGIGFVANSIGSWWQGLPAWWNLGFEYEGSKWWAEVKNRPWGMLLGALSLVGLGLAIGGVLCNLVFLGFHVLCQMPGCYINWAKFGFNCQKPENWTEHWSVKTLTFILFGWLCAVVVFTLRGLLAWGQFGFNLFDPQHWPERKYTGAMIWNILLCGVGPAVGLVSFAVRTLCWTAKLLQRVGCWLKENCTWENIGKFLGTGLLYFCFTVVEIPVVISWFVLGGGFKVLRKEWKNYGYVTPSRLLLVIPFVFPVLLAIKTLLSSCCDMRKLSAYLDPAENKEVVIAHLLEKEKSKRRDTKPESLQMYKKIYEKIYDAMDQDLRAGTLKRDKVLMQTVDEGKESNQPSPLKRQQVTEKERVKLLAWRKQLFCSGHVRINTINSSDTGPLVSGSWHATVFDYCFFSFSSEWRKQLGSEHLNNGWKCEFHTNGDETQDWLEITPDQNELEGGVPLLLGNA